MARKKRKGKGKRKKKVNRDTLGLISTGIGLGVGSAVVEAVPTTTAQGAAIKATTQRGLGLASVVSVPRGAKITLKGLKELEKLK